MSLDQAPAIRIIGVGNEMRGDDGIGPSVVRAVRDALPPNARALIASGEGASLMDMWEGADFVILVDAVGPAGNPGRIHRLDAGAQPLPSSFFHYSTHAFSVAEAVEMARALGTLPPRILVFGVEGKRFDAGHGLSSEASAAVRKVAGMIRDEFGRGTQPPDAGRAT